jgi:hypothetical protein
MRCKLKAGCKIGQSGGPQPERRAAAGERVHVPGCWWWSTAALMGAWPRRPATALGGQGTPATAYNRWGKQWAGWVISSLLSSHCIYIPFLLEKIIAFILIIV